MKMFKNARVRVAGKGFITTDLVFDTHTRAIGAWEGTAEAIALPSGAYVVPGFIDTHIHGAGGADTMDATPEALAVVADTLVREGTTSFLATTMTASRADTRAALAAVGAYCASERTAGARCLGVHMEGPCLSPKYAGAQPAAYMEAPCTAYFEEMLAVPNAAVRLVTIAPELDGAEEVIRHLSDRGVRVNIGHSDAGVEEIQTAILAGATGVTHTYNAQRPLHHRELGVTGSALLMDPLRCELIADGVHVSVPAMYLLFKCKGRDNVTLVTDAMRMKGMGDGVGELGRQTVRVSGGEARLADGTLAGSVATMNQCVKTLVRELGLSLEQAVACATTNPARALGLEDTYGTIAVGAVADYAVLDASLRVLMTIRDGEVVYRAE